MIAHVSIPSAHPRETAKTLGRLLGGEVMQFVPLGSEGYVVYSGSHHNDGVLIEVLHEDLRYLPGLEEGEAVVYGRVTSAPGVEPYSISHVAVTTIVPLPTLRTIAADAGWRLIECWRGRAFPQVEVWVENRYMIELMTAEQAELYVASMQPRAYAAMFGMTPAADGVLEPSAEVAEKMDAVRQAQTQRRRVTLG